MDNVEERVAYLEGRFEEQIMTISDIHDSVVRLDGRFDRVEQQVDRLTQRMDDRFDRLDTRFGWFVGLVLAVGIAMVGALLQR